MKNTVLWTSLFTLIGTQAFADLTPEPVPQTVAPTPSVAPAPPPTPLINCDYKIPAQTKTVDQNLVLSWSEKALVQSFSFDPNVLDVELQKLQACFTEQGWTGFNSALQKSGNIDAIKAQKLIVTSKIDGQSSITDVKDNQWKLTIPLLVTYENEKEKVNQMLNVDLLVGRKPSGDLGITQMIAVPRNTAVTEKPAAVLKSQ